MKMRLVECVSVELTKKTELLSDISYQSVFIDNRSVFYQRAIFIS